ncbi:MAG: T9SS type A sorting domain-containing protein [Lentimicrobiaceae bacterium]|nr:T9SS type A sorting domain-containing protein [Lentimicrobiaceae bacterium]
MKSRFLKISILCFCIYASSFVLAQEILWKKNFGGTRNDFYSGVTSVSDGIIAVGYSDFGSFENGDWEDIEGKGDVDAIIIKYDQDGNVIWKSNFGGNGIDRYDAVYNVLNGVVAVGYSSYSSFGTGDWEEFESKGYQDAVMVMYDNDGNIVWKKNFGGKQTGYTRFFSVTALPDGIVAAGYSDGFGEGDWEDMEGNGSDDAIMVKYDYEGNIVWKINFGGNDVDRFFSITEASDGIVAVGISYSGSFESGDWELDTCKGNKDAIMVKYDTDGNVMWKKNFGGISDDIFYSVTAVSDGLVAVGISFPNSFETGDWKEITGKGWEDAMIVKYDNDGEIVWKKNFGGNGRDCFYAVTEVANGLVAVGGADGFSSGDWANIAGKGNDDAIIVRFDHEGNVIWKNNFGGNDTEIYYALTAFSDAIVAVGYANFNSFNSGDWDDMESKGWEDAVTVKYNVENIGIIELPVSNVTKIQVYPNPTAGELTITNYDSNNGINSLVIEVFDVYGRKLLIHPLIPSSSHHFINISHLPAGIYILRVENDVVKVVKQ